MANKFSEETKEIIAWSREIALELGYNYISTLHFLLADSYLNGKSSIKTFCFASDEEYARFYESKRIGDATVFGDNLKGNVFLTKEAERTVRLSMVEWKKHSALEVQPFHLFLAAASHYSTFSSLLPPEEDLYDRLLVFYKQGGHIPEKLPKQTFIQKVTSFWKK